jgi:hypothetical protein
MVDGNMCWDLIYTMMGGANRRESRSDIRKPEREKAVALLLNALTV